MNDPAVVKVSEKFVRIIIRRPHAYRFKARYSLDGKMPIPGFVVLNSKGKLVMHFGLNSALSVVAKLNSAVK